MELRIIDKYTETLFEEIRRRIHRLQSGGTIDSLREIGADPGKQVGASYVSLKNLASAYRPDESLALLLWNCQRREEQIMACLLFPPEMNKEKITQLIPSCLNYEIAGYLGSLYLYKLPDLAEAASGWLDTGLPFLQLATLAALARHLIINKENSLVSRDFFLNALNRSYKDKYVQLTAERYRFNI